MKKYKLECYGWEMEALCHSLDNDKVERINKLVEEGQELYEVVHDIEDCDVDIYSPDLFHITRGLDNGTMKFYLKDEDDNEILTFDIEQVRVVWDSFDYEGGYTSLSAFPEDDNRLFIAFESKGGICSYEFESDEFPKMEDFSYLNGDIETPEGCWDFIDKIFFKGEELEIEDCLDRTNFFSMLPEEDHINLRAPHSPILDAWWMIYR